VQQELTTKFSSLPPDNCFASPQLSVAFRRFVCRDRRQGLEKPNDPKLYAELHVEGSVFAVSRVGSRLEGQLEVLFPNHLIDVTVELIERAVEHAVRCGCVGDGLLSVRLILPEGRSSAFRLPAIDGAVWPSDLEPFSASGPLHSRLTVPVLRTQPDAMLVLRQVMSEFYQCFGVPEFDLIDSEGLIDRQRWRDLYGYEPESVIHRRGSFKIENFRPRG
jgi:hypothetical protein